MVFQDGGGYLDPHDDIRGATVLDNLIHAGAIPPMVGVFVDPGVFPEVENPRERKNRNAEYASYHWNSLCGRRRRSANYPPTWGASSHVIVLGQRVGQCRVTGSSQLRV